MTRSAKLSSPDILDDEGNLKDSYRGFIAVSKYARWIEEKGRRETWTETVDRYVDYMASYQRKRGVKVPDSTLEEIRHAIKYHHIMPSMRALMTAGPALDRNHIAAFNCFAGAERFITSQGLKSFAETVGTKQTVLNGEGRWVQAEVKSFGVQTLNRVSFRPGGRSKTKLRHDILVTPDHRWITVNRGEVTDLKVGDQVKFVGTTFELIPEAFLRGFGFGDGTIDSKGHARVRLCGTKNQWLPMFEEYGRSSIMSPPSFGDDHLIIFHRGVMEDIKELPQDMPAEWLASWLMGYLAADGHAAEKQPGISSQDRAALDFVREIAPLAGYMVTGDNQSTNVETNFGPRSAPLHRLTLRKGGVFKVMAIEEDVVEEEVFCAVVPDGADFALERGIHTGNCSFIAIDSIRSFDEALVILMHGTGLGFSVETKHTNKLPEVAESFHSTDTTVRVEDSKEGWAKALKDYLSLLWAGQIPKYDVSAVRPKGSRLKTFGGRASGPEPLVDLFEFTKDILVKAAGRKLSSLEIHDIMCKIGEIVVVGGVRRSALISLSDIGDREMAEAKAGAWWVNNSQRALANNSATYYTRPNMDVFFREWKNLYDSKSGERGIVNLDASRRQAEKIGRRDVKQLEGTNPCGEIILRNKGFCNLTEVVARAEDTAVTLKEKVRLATILGTWQASLTNFKYLRRKWKENAEEESLLGVSITGIFGNTLLSGKEGLDKLSETLTELREYAVSVNKSEARRIGINQAGAVTCVKPSGTVSQLTGVSSGIHPWYSQKYVRRVRGNNSDPLTRMMKDRGVPHEPELNKPEDTTVFEFPLEAPEGAILQENLTAIEHLNLWLTYRNNWTEHNPSITVTVEEHEWLEVGAFVYKHFEEMSGVSFLPGAGNHTYQQAPFEALSDVKFEELKKESVVVPWSGLSLYEQEDGTTSSQELACVAGECEVVDLEDSSETEKISVPEINLEELVLNSR